MKNIFILFLLLCNHSSFLIGQEIKGKELIDSLILESEKISDKETKVGYLYKIAFEFYQVDPEKGMEFANRTLKMAKNIDSKYWEAMSYNAMGVNYYALQDYQRSTVEYKKALLIYKEMDNKLAIATILSNIANNFSAQLNFKKSLEYNFKSLTIYEEEGSDGILIPLTNIAVVYASQNEYDKALGYYSKVIELDRKENNMEGIAITNMFISNLYNKTKSYDKAFEFIDESINIFQGNGNDFRLSEAYQGKAKIYFNMGQYSNALDYNKRSFKISEEIKYNKNAAETLGEIGKCYYQMSQNKSDELNNINAINQQVKINEAIKYLEEAISRFTAKSSNNTSPELLYYLANCYNEKGESNKAFDLIKRHIVLKDSLFNLEKTREIASLISQRDKIENEREEAEEERIKAEAITYRNSLQYLGLGAIVIFFVVLIILQGRMKFNEIFARGLVFITFILTFEFALVMIDPFTDDYSEGEPVIKFAINLALALIIFPMHQFFERRVTKTLLSRGYGSSIEKVLEEFKNKKSSNP